MKLPSNIAHPYLINQQLHLPGIQENLLFQAVPGKDETEIAV